MIMNAARYAYRVKWHADYHEYIGTCIEFPELYWMAPTASGALQGICTMVDNVLVDMRQLGEEPPPVARYPVTEENAQ